MTPSHLGGNYLVHIRCSTKCFSETQQHSTSICVHCCWHLSMYFFAYVDTRSEVVSIYQHTSLEVGSIRRQSHNGSTNNYSAPIVRRNTTLKIYVSFSSKKFDTKEFFLNPSLHGSIPTMVSASYK